jgi:hypothetical protein
MPMTNTANQSRRTFLKSSAALGAAGALLCAGYSRRAIPVDSPSQPRKPVIDEYDDKNIKLAHRVSSSISDDDLLFLKQIGLRWARVELQVAESAFDALSRVQERFARFGIKIFSAMHPAYRSLKIQLGQTGRDQDIEQYQTFLRNLGRLGIPVANYDFHPGNTYTTAQVQRRAYTAREFNLKDFRNRVEKQRFTREYSAEDIWSNYTYFIKAVLPVAEEAGVKLALHPDDPPLAKMNGVAKIIVHYDGYRRAEQIVGTSRHWGLTFCVGTWAEGGASIPPIRCPLPGTFPFRSTRRDTLPGIREGTVYRGAYPVAIWGREGTVYQGAYPLAIYG